MSGTIYRIYVEQVGKSYVGCTQQAIDFVWSQAKSRLGHHRHTCKPLQAAVDEYGLSQAKFEILEVVENDDALLAEQADWMKRFDCFNKKVTKKQKKSRAGKPVTYNHKDYPSITAAAKDAGLTVKQMRWRLEMGYEYEEEVQIWPFVPEKFPMEWEGTLYPSIRQAALSSGISYAKMRRYRDLGISTAAQVAAYEALQIAEQRRLDERRRREWLEEQARKKREELNKLEDNIKRLSKED